MNAKSFYISVDIEGVACTVGNFGQGIPAGSFGYDFACRQATKEANAAAKALFDRGAERVIIWDSHGTGVNLDYDSLDNRAEIAIGAGSKLRFPIIDDSFGGVLFIGAHAYDSPSAVLSHVYSSSTFQYHTINGEFVGEMQIDGAIAGKRGVPVIFASGDDECVRQAKHSFGDIPTVVTKKALAWNNCISRHPEAVCSEIYQKVSQAYDVAQTAKPFVIPEPFMLEIRYKRMEYAQNCPLRTTEGKPFEHRDGYTRCGMLASLEEYFEC